MAEIRNPGNVLVGVVDSLNISADVSPTVFIPNAPVGFYEVEVVVTDDGSGANPLPFIYFGADFLVVPFYSDAAVTWLQGASLDASASQHFGLLKHYNPTAQDIKYEIQNTTGAIGFDLHIRAIKWL